MIPACACARAPRQPARRDDSDRLPPAAGWQRSWLSLATPWDNPIIGLIGRTSAAA